MSLRSSGEIWVAIPVAIASSITATATLRETIRMLEMCGNTCPFAASSGDRHSASAVRKIVTSFEKE